MTRRIALFDYRVIPTNPVGGCHLRLLDALCGTHRFTVFAVQFANPCPERIEWVRVPAPTRPLALLFVAFHLLAPLCYLVHRIRTRTRFDLVQVVESNVAFGDISYAHFCHRSFLRRHWAESRPAGLRGILRWLDHALHALAEPVVFRRVRSIVVPSRGLQRELADEYPTIAHKITVLPNPIDPERMRKPADFDRDAARRELGVEPDDTVLVFVALGHFERKGLPILLDALRHATTPDIKLVVVGGTDDLIRRYRARCRELGLDNRVRFVGMRRDVRPYLWAADAFVLPSSYETFSLVSFEAAAAGLPLIVSPLYGVSDILRDGVNGFLVDRTAGDLAAAIVRMSALTPVERLAMGVAAQLAVETYRPETFVADWRSRYAERALDYVA